MTQIWTKCMLLELFALDLAACDSYNFHTVPANNSCYALCLRLDKNEAPTFHMESRPDARVCHYQPVKVSVAIGLLYFVLKIVDPES